MLRVVVCLVTLAVTAGCAAREPVRSIRSGPGARDARPPQESLESFIDQVRAKSERARPVPNRPQTIEMSDSTLAAALQALTAQPTAEAHRAVAARYVRHGILDVAHEHFSAAVKLNPMDGSSWDGLARIWRDWGFPHLALPDAYRAVYFSPASPSAHNTLGTVLQKLGRSVDARAQFEQALALDVTAAYALSNLCYGWMVEGDAAKAADACRQALRLQPDLQSARNTLALAYEAVGDHPAALETLAASADTATAAYNEGLLHLAHRNYREALKAFDTARTARPRFRAAEAMSRQARAHLQEIGEP